jgi:hypothetical protein
VEVKRFPAPECYAWSATTVGRQIGEAARRITINVTGSGPETASNITMETQFGRRRGRLLPGYAVFVTA